MTPRFRWVLPAALLLAAASAVAGWLLRPAPRDPPPGPPWFADATDEVGLSFTHDPGTVGDYFMPQIMGSGVALLDVDGDDLLDIYLLHQGGPEGRKNQLFKQKPDGTFVDASAGSGLDLAGFSTGVAVGDVNNDGHPDLVVTQYGGARLLLNKGGTFRDATDGSGLVNLDWATSAAFADLDGDGWLDLVVVNYLAYDPGLPCFSATGQRDYCHPRQFPGTVTRLFRNLGAKGQPGKFEDVTERSGLARLKGPGLGVVCADFDGDGRTDIFVANDGKPNHLWVQQKDGTFREEAVSRGIALDAMGRAPANMGVALGDLDGDGLFDIFVTHLTDETHTLWAQGPRGLFRDRTQARGLAPPGSRGTGFGTVAADFDNDGGLDVAVVNGRIAAGTAVDRDRLGAHFSRYAERNQLFASDGRGRFTERGRAEPAFCGLPGVYRGLAMGDLRNRGGIDLVVTAIGERARVYRNVAPRGHWLGVRVVDPALKRDAYGAEVIVEAGGRRHHRWINPGSSYLSSNDPRAHFGLGDAERVDRIRVRWPGGGEEVFAGRRADAHVTLKKGEGER